jgi:hypothetical protein
MAFLGRTTKGSNLTAIELDKNFLSHYPIGAIYMNANRSDSPNNYIGYGVWNKFAEGRILISADSLETSNGWHMYTSNGSAPDVFTDNAGGGGRHNNVQPYITVYMWERTAE